MNDEMIPVSQDDKLPFGCSLEKGCLNECCKNINQFLTPYDIIRLKHRLELVSSEFLRTYTSLMYGPETGLPMIVFKPDPHAGYACPFVTEKGCSVYEDRPGSCRLYPLARAVSRSRETGELTEYYAVIHEDHCKGFDSPGTQTVAQWLSGQDVEPFNKMNDRLMEIISLKTTMMPGKLAGRQSDQFYLALYDLDTFRNDILNNDLLGTIQVPESVLEQVREDDTVLLELGIAWVKHELFGIPMVFEGF